MSTIVVDAQSVHIPPSVKDFGSFREWLHSDEFPESGRICYLNNDVWVDMSKEQFAHNQIKGEISSVLTQLAKREQLGRFFPDGYRFSQTATGLSTNPDGIFVSAVSFQRGRVQLIEGAEGGHVELEGVPEMVLEVVSDSSVQKDTVDLRDAYWRAGVREYWLVDGRGSALRFDILRRTRRGYTATRRQAGWLPSQVFGKSFRLTEGNDALGYPEYTLAVR
jgi:Uma2 family endonuclease